MKCKDVQKMYIAFINNELSIPELKLFLEHLEECEDCKEEYDVYYTMIMGMRYLENDNLSEELRIDSGERLQAAKERLLRYKAVKVIKILVLILLCLIVISLL